MGEGWPGRRIPAAPRAAAVGVTPAKGIPVKGMPAMYQDHVKCTSKNGDPGIYCRYTSVKFINVLATFQYVSVRFIMYSNYVNVEFH